MTGGRERPATVSLYTEQGYSHSLPSLQDPRLYHACGSFLTEQGSRVGEEE